MLYSMGRKPLVVPNKRICIVLPQAMIDGINAAAQSQKMRKSALVAQFVAYGLKVMEEGK